MATREPNAGTGEDFCEINSPERGLYLPCGSGDLPWLLREVWSIMDDEQRDHFVLEVIDDNYADPNEGCDVCRGFEGDVFCQACMRGYARP